MLRVHHRLLMLLLPDALAGSRFELRRRFTSPFVQTIADSHGTCSLVKLTRTRRALVGARVPAELAVRMTASLSLEVTWRHSSTSCVSDIPIPHENYVHQFLFVLGRMQVYCALRVLRSIRLSRIMPSRKLLRFGVALDIGEDLVRILSQRLTK